MKHIEPLEALAKIKIELNKFYESVGKDELYDVDARRTSLVESISDTIEKVKIPAKNLIVAEFDNEIEKQKEGDDEYY